MKFSPIVAMGFKFLSEVCWYCVVYKVVASSFVIGSDSVYLLSRKGNKLVSK